MSHSAGLSAIYTITHGKHLRFGNTDENKVNNYALVMPIP